MLWIALHLPHLPLQALRWSPAGAEATAPGWHAMLPLAVSQTIAQQPQLIAVNRAAAALGLRPGQSVATALSLVSQLIVLPRDPDREQAFVHRLALALGVLTPNIAVEASGVLLEVQASLRLFGGLRRLLRRAEAVARQCGAQPRLAVAPQASAAWLLATHGRGPRRGFKRASCARRLDRLPVMALGELLPLTPRQTDLLQMLGIQQFAALRALPPAGLQRRLGVALHAALLRAYGEAPDPRAWLAPPEHFSAGCELMQRADNAEVLIDAVAALLPPLLGWLQLRWQAATALVLWLRHEHRRQRTPDTLLTLQLSTPSRDMAQIALLWRERLQRHTLAAPVYDIELVLERSTPHGGTPGELLPTAGSKANEHAALLDRLVARLGADRVQRYEPLADHRPERAQRAVSVMSSASQGSSAGSSAGSSSTSSAFLSTGSSALSSSAGSAAPSAGPHTSAGMAPPGHAAQPTSPADSAPATEPAPARPVWLLDPPLPLACDAHGRPWHDGPLRLRSRAERIETGWFDGAPARRDYHVAEGVDHRLRWIYRERGAPPAHECPGAGPGQGPAESAAEAGAERTTPSVTKNVTMNATTNATARTPHRSPADPARHGPSPRAGHAPESPSQSRPDEVRWFLHGWFG